MVLETGCGYLQIQEIDKLLDEKHDQEDINILNATKEKLLSMKN